MSNGEKPKTGRPTLFTAELAERICARLAEGYTVEAVGEEEGFPAAGTIFRWLATQDAPRPKGQENTPGPHAAFREAYVRACELRAAPRFERLRVLGEMALADPAKANAVKVAADIEKWCLAREAPKKYGDRTTLVGDKEAPVEVRKTVELSDEALAAIAAGGLREVD